ncbi:Abscisic acid receptor PYR1 [Spatholobus suberectus]|nr:Abscisic acid receptor PYR1 [Spatholobus suberectus]
MEKGESSASTSEPDSDDHRHPTSHHLNPPSGLTAHEFASLVPSVTEHHTYLMAPGQCSSLFAQRVHAPPDAVWSVVRRFDRPQAYKHFIRSCAVEDPFHMAVGCTRDVIVISGLPAATSTERLDLLDDHRRVTGFSIIGGEHRLRNYRSVTTVHGFDDANADGKIYTVVLESYIVDAPDGSTEEDTRLFVDTVVKLNLQKLASVSEGTNRDGDGVQEMLTCDVRRVFLTVL